MRNAFLTLSCTVLLSAPNTVLRIVDPQGLAISGARVEIRSPGGGQPAQRLVSGGNGEVSTVLHASAEIRVTAPGFEPLTRRLDSVPWDAVRLCMQPSTLRTSVEVVVREEERVSDPSVGSALEIDRSGARTVLDAVDKLVPGAFVTRRGVMGYGIATNGTGGVSIRGVGGQPNTDILVVVDGRPDFMGLMGHPLPDFYSLSNAESVSVTQGPASVLYGSNAMGGVVEIKPARPREGRETRLSASVGSYLTGQHRLSHGASLGNGFYSLHAGVDHTGGDRDSSAYRGQDAAASFGYTLSPAWQASVQGRYGHFHVEDPGPVHAPLANSYARVGRGGVSIHLDNTGSRAWGYARFYSSHGRHIITDGFRSVDNTTGGRILQSFYVTPALTLDAGADVVVNGGRARNIHVNRDYGQHHMSTAAGITRLLWAPRERMRFNAGFRYDHNSVHGAVTVPEFGASYGFSEDYSVGVAVARGFRNPTIRELYLFPAPNPSLEPQYIWNYQVSLQARPAPQIQAVLTAYYAHLENLIVTTGRFPNLRLQNSGAALNRGWEGTVRWRPARRIHFNSGYAYLRSTNLAPYIPQQKWNSSMDLDAGGVFFHFGTSVVGRRWADAARARQLGGYTVGTAKCTVPLRGNLNVFVMVDNLFDHRYEVLSGYPMPGINTIGGMSLRF